MYCKCLHVGYSVSITTECVELLTSKKYKKYKRLITWDLC